jgi:hypothetical protein
MRSRETDWAGTDSIRFFCPLSSFLPIFFPTENRGKNGLHGGLGLFPKVVRDLNIKVLRRANVCVKANNAAAALSTEEYDADDVDDAIDHESTTPSARLGAGSSRLLFAFGALPPWFCTLADLAHSRSKNPNVQRCTAAQSLGLEDTEEFALSFAS